MLAATPFLQLSAQWRVQQLKMLSPAMTQHAELSRLLVKAADTKFGRDHDFKSIESVADFQARVPLRKYADFWDEYWKDDFPVLKGITWPSEIPYFALTSGTTTGVTKHIPVSRDMVRSNVKGALEVLLNHMISRPSTAVLGGRFLVLGGSTALPEIAPGVRAGDLSGIEAVETPWWAKPYTLPSEDIALLSDWEEKIDRIGRMVLDQDIRSITGTPNWMLVFFDKLAELRPTRGPFRIADYFPNLELIIYGGMDFKPYARRFKDVLRGTKADLREAYAASEGFMACADRGPGDGMRLILDSGIFFEFVPLDELDSPNPTRHWLANVETGVDYAVVLSTCAGVWGYVIGDTVRFVQTDPPRVLISGRTAYVLTAFGEHVIDFEMEEAMDGAADAVGVRIAEYSVAARFPEPGERGRHRYVVEFLDPQPSPTTVDKFLKEVDQRLGRLNADYESMRDGGVSIADPEIAAVPRGTFVKWMKSRGKMGGQHKVPRIISDQDLAKGLWAFCGLNEGPL